MICENEIVLCDFGGTMAGYCSDMTRTVVLGPMDTKTREILRIVRRAQQAKRRQPR